MFPIVETAATCLASAVVTLNTSKHSSSKGLRQIAVVGLFGLLAAGAHGQNLITNAGFESGASGYTTGYGANDTTPTTSGTAGVTVAGSSSTIFGSGSTSLTTHGGTQFFAVNGSTTGTATVWEQNVSSLVIGGLTGSTFTFSFWIAAGNAESVKTSPNQRPVIAVTINGTSLGSITASTTAGAWTQFTATWTRGTNTVADIKLVDTRTTGTGNDFVLDDFVLVPEPSTYAAGVFLIGAGLFAWRKARRTSV